MQKLVCVVASVLLLSSAARADASREPATQADASASFDALDRNRDGRLSRSDAGFDRQLSIIFADSDLDGDGFLSLTEYARAIAGPSSVEKTAQADRP